MPIWDQFSGGKSIPNPTGPESCIDIIHPGHKIACYAAWAAYRDKRPKRINTNWQYYWDKKLKYAGLRFGWLSAFFRNGNKEKNQAIYVNPVEKQVLIAFRGTAELADYITDAELVVGTLAYGDRGQEARRVVSELKKLFPGYSLISTGHSLGGTLALTVDRTPGVDLAVTFNMGSSMLLNYVAADDEVDYHIVGDDVISASFKSKHLILIKTDNSNKHNILNFFDKNNPQAKDAQFVHSGESVVVNIAN